MSDAIQELKTATTAAEVEKALGNIRSQETPLTSGVRTAESQKIKAIRTEIAEIDKQLSASESAGMSGTNAHRALRSREQALNLQLIEEQAKLKGPQPDEVRART